MDLPFVADGAWRILRSPEFLAKLRALRAGIAARHAAELASAGRLGRCRLRWRMALEYWRERRRLVPSPHALYAVPPRHARPARRRGAPPDSLAAP